MAAYSPELDLIGMSHRYSVLIDVAPYHFGDWAKVTGLTVSWEPIVLRTGDQPNLTVTMPGHTKYERIKLSRAACAQSRTVKDWLTQTSQNPQPQSGAIQLLDSVGQLLVEWRLNEFFPVAWSITDFDANGAKPVMETLELVHSGFLSDQVKLNSPY